jgi:hypothetical protein
MRLVAQDIFNTFGIAPALRALGATISLVIGLGVHLLT